MGKKLSNKKPEKNLTTPIKKTGGRNSSGRRTADHRGGGAKRRYRKIDFKRTEKLGVPAEIVAFEYDPNRSAHIALIEYEDGEKSYILAPKEAEVGDKIMSDDITDPRPGNRLRLKNIPVGAMVYNIELEPGRGGKMARSAGTSVKLLAKQEKLVNLKMPSSEVRQVLANCFATIGSVSNAEHRFKKDKKAGTSRHKGKRPKVRGTAKNAVDHPHGGGEGRTGTGRHPKTKQGKPAKGVKTRKDNKWTNKYIVEKRKKKK